MQYLLTVISLLIPILTGYFLMDVCILGRKPVLKACLGTGLGFGIASVLFFVWLLLFNSFSIGYLILEVLLLIVAVIFRNKCKFPAFHSDKPFKINQVAVVGFVIGLILTFSTFIFFVFKDLYGNWDGTRIVNTAAKFMYLGADNWLDLFKISTPLSRIDYPLMLPSLVARGWGYAGGVIPFVPISISFLFYYASVFLITSTVWQKDRNLGVLAGCFLLFAQPYYVNGAAQYTDIPLSFYMLASLSCVLLYSWDRERGYLLSLAGMMAGFTCWMKNEGAVFSIALIIGLLASSYILKTGYKKLLPFLYGFAPVLAVFLGFKTFLAPPNDMFANQSVVGAVINILDPARYALILKEFAKKIFTLGVGQIPFYVLGVFLLISGIKIDEKTRFCMYSSAITLVVMFLAYFAIYLITPHNLQWHLDNSLFRVFTHIWPMAVIICMMAVKTPQEKV